MAVPARKTSKTKKCIRRGHIKLSVPGLTPCPSCGELHKSYMVYPGCGYYGGKQIVNTNS